MPGYPVATAEPPPTPDYPVAIAAESKHPKWKMENRYQSDALPPLPEPRPPSVGGKASEKESDSWKIANRDAKDSPPALPAPRKKSSLVSRMSRVSRAWSQRRANRSQRDALPAPPVPEKKKPQIHEDKRDDHHDRARTNNIRNFFIDRFVKDRSPAMTGIAVLVVSAILVIIGVGIYIITLYAGKRRCGKSVIRSSQKCCILQHKITIVMKMSLDIQA